ncbi:hypothetical protein [Salinimicrobium sp. GXAS 041]|uniref:hypothetical protein n=1 Tax=Salinimicrobium sp. GXAS 041 TaxID=3400806 RepID=UPI003C75AA83
MDGTVKIPDLVDYMKREGLVWAKESELLPVKLKERYLRKKSLTYKEISDARLWGKIGKKAVEAIAKSQVLSHEKFKEGNAFKIRISAVRRIGEKRGSL